MNDGFDPTDEVDNLIAPAKTRPDETLGDLLRLVTALFGADSAATKFVQAKVDEEGADIQVVAPEEQVVYLMLSLHNGGEADGQEVTL